MDRIVILGRAGAGKTTLARRLGEIIGAPVIVLDAIWQPHWTEKDVSTFRAAITYAHAGDKWISDGNFALATFDIRLPRATLIIWLDCPKLRCSWRVVRRVMRREEPHRVRGLINALRFIWKFDSVNRPRIEASRLLHGPEVQVLELKSDRDLADFLAALGRDQKSSV